MIINNLGKILYKKKMPVSQLSEITGFTVQYLNRFKHNKPKSYKSSTISKICNALGINSSELLTFVSDNLDFKIVKHYSKQFSDDDGNTYWIHLVLKAINTHFSKNSDNTYTSRTIGYFNFDDKIEAERNKLKVAYQVSESIPLYELHRSGLAPINRNYLYSVISNKNNLIKCVLLSVSLHNMALIRTVGDINPDNINRDSKTLKPTPYGFILSKIDIAPIAIINGLPNRDSYGLVLEFDKLPYIKGDIQINKQKDKSVISNSKISFKNWHYRTSLTDKRDMAIFTLFIPGSHLGGNGLNIETDRPDLFEWHLKARQNQIENRIDELNNQDSKLKRLINRVDSHNEKIRNKK